ncbi:hypothetical protein M0804_000424 [Polistes exclamans]|nr:hypothetical protein M0804_000424 [Polistes exclamans]
MRLSPTSWPSTERIDFNLTDVMNSLNGNPPSLYPLLPQTSPSSHRLQRSQGLVCAFPEPQDLPAAAPF